VARPSTKFSTKSTSSSIELLLTNIRRAYEGKGWHGPTLKGALRGVTLAQATRRPTRNSIRDLVYHSAYWKYCVRRWLLEAAGNGPGPAFPRSPANFPDPAEQVTDKTFAVDKRMLDDQHRRLVAALKALPVRELDKPAGNTGMTLAEVILGIAAHDLYHAGQVSLIKRL
jgi:uncharacterized damage-inducible protein DinB